MQMASKISPCDVMCVDDCSCASLVLFFPIGWPCAKFENGVSTSPLPGRSQEEVIISSGTPANELHVLRSGLSSCLGWVEEITVEARGATMSHPDLVVKTMKNPWFLVDLKLKASHEMAFFAFQLYLSDDDARLASNGWKSAASWRLFPNMKYCCSIRNNSSAKLVLF